MNNQCTVVLAELWVHIALQLLRKWRLVSVMCCRRHKAKIHRTNTRSKCKQTAIFKSKHRNIAVCTVHTAQAHTYTLAGWLAGVMIHEIIVLNLFLLLVDDVHKANMHRKLPNIKCFIRNFQTIGVFSMEFACYWEDSIVHAYEIHAQHPPMHAYSDINANLRIGSPVAHCVYANCFFVLWWRIRILCVI